MRSESSGAGSISWREGNEKDDVPEHSTAFKSIHDGQWQSYSVEMPLKAVLKTIRIQPSEGEGRIELKNIKLTTVDGYYIRDWPLY